METLFIRILNLSITAGWIVLAVLLLRLVLKQAPKWLHAAMWALVGIRLVCPFSLESIFSLIPSTETVPQDILYAQSPAIHSGITPFNAAVNPVLTESFAPTVGDSVNPMQVVMTIASAVWVAGIGGMLLYSLISFLRIRRSVREAIPLQENIRVCDRIDTPFILGVFRPQIYLPSVMPQEDMTHVIAHEHAHLQRRDHLWKPLGFLLLSVHWFNPLLWAAYVLLCRDIELACDEKVIAGMDITQRKAYSSALLSCSLPRRTIAACPLAFGEVGVKTRIRRILHYKRPAFWILLVSAAALAITAVCFLTNPRTTDHEALRIFLDCQISAHHQRYADDETYGCPDAEILSIRRSGSKLTVYTWVFYETYTFDGTLQRQYGAHIPTVITVEETGNTYRLVQYWEPRDGSYNLEDILRKFPFYLWHNATDSQKYVQQQNERCERMAMAHFEAMAQSEDANTPQTYDFTDSVDPITPELTLSPNRTFVFSYSGYSSYLPRGFYVLTDTALTLCTDDGQNTYVFRRDGENFVFDADDSSPIPSYRYASDAAYAECPVPDGAVFAPQLVPQTYSLPVYDRITADVDGDGITEDCSLIHGPTSGVFSLRFIAYETGSESLSPEYHIVYSPIIGGDTVAFEIQPDGSLAICCENTSSEQVWYYDLIPENGSIAIAVRDASQNAHP